MGKRAAKEINLIYFDDEEEGYISNDRDDVDVDVVSYI